MAKIFSILTLIAAAIVLYFGMESQKLVTTLQEKGKAQYEDLTRTKQKLKDAEEDLKTAKQELADTKGELEKSKTSLRETEQKLTDATNQLTTAKAELAAANDQLGEIKKAIEAVLPGEGIEGIKSLQSKITGLVDKTKEQEAAIVQLEKERTDLQAKVADFEQTTKSQEDKLASQGTVLKRYKENIMQKGVQGRVMAVNAGWGFCVVSIGDKAGAAANKILIVARDGKAIGKLKITNVESTQSVADIVPNSFVRGLYVQPGDSVIYTGEDKIKSEESEPEASTAQNSPELPRR